MIIYVMATTCREWWFIEGNHRNMIQLVSSLSRITDGWNTIVSFWGPAYFQMRSVRFRDGNRCGGFNDFLNFHPQFFRKLFCIASFTEHWFQWLSWSLYILVYFLPDITLLDIRGIFSAPFLSLWFNLNLGGGFKYFFFTTIWGRFPIWLIFFKWVGSTTN